MTTRTGTGYVDAHVHLIDAGGLSAAAAAGVVAVRDAGTRDGAGLQVRSEGKEVLPRIVTAGWALYPGTGYGSRFGAAVRTRAEIRAEIDRLRKAKADIIKVMASGIVSLKRPTEITAGGFGPDELAFIVSEAAAHGLGVMAHANGERAIVAAAEAGVRSLEHGFFMTERALAVMAERGTFWVPTVGALARAAEADGASKQARTFVEDLVRSHLAMIGQAFEAGVPLAVGTDCVLPGCEYRKAYEQELAYFEEAGIPRTDVLRIACEGGARLLGITL